MTYPILISHATQDAELSRILARTLERCSLRQIMPWFSSDPEGSGGLMPGDRWFDSIRSQLKKSKAVLVLITPNSAGSSWVHFEAGFGAAHSELEIIPLLVGITEIADIPRPLGHWQTYRLDSLQTSSEFLRKLFSRLEIHFDDEFAGAALKDLVGYCGSIEFKDTNLDEGTELSRSFTKLQNHLERKLFDIQSRLPSSNISSFGGYSVTIENMISNKIVSVYVDDRKTVLDILNDIYFQIPVKAWTYLSKWIIKDIDTEEKIVIREISAEIPAHYIFRPDRALIIEELGEPYSGLDSEGVGEG